MHELISNKRIHTTRGDGRWFPASPTALRREVNTFIEHADPPPATNRIVAAIAPHAGFVYSGPVAGYTYRAIRDAATAGTPPDVVIVLGLSHRPISPGVALLDADILRSPMGDTTLDTRTAAQMAGTRSLIRMDSAPHCGEHSAENQLPFLQAALPDTPVVVGIMGDHSRETRRQLLEALQEVARTRTVLVIASTDLLHDADYANVSATDRDTLSKITALDATGLSRSWTREHQVCCGIGPVVTAIDFARSQGCTNGTLLHYRNSGDDHPESRGNWVVGYGAVIFPVTP